MNELTLIPKEDNAQQLMRRATDVAGVCKEIVLKTACSIQGKKYVKCEGWMSIATAYACTASSRDVEKIDGGWRAIGEIKRMSDGMVLSSAEGFVGLDEVKTWGQRPEYACRAMAQTRAISRACRAAFAHVVVLMDAGLSTTPAEEVPDGGFAPEAHKPAQNPVHVQSDHPTVQSAPAVNPSPNTPIPALNGWRSFIVPVFVKKYAGQTLGDMAKQDLAYWCQKFEPKPYKGVISQDNIDFRAALDLALNDLRTEAESDSRGSQETIETDEVPF